VGGFFLFRFNLHICWI
ncbi:hypothetical protein V3C99_009502, partial [Haemonchus contortus]